MEGLQNYDNSLFVCDNVGGIESLLTKLKDYTPVVPDSTTESILQHVGVNTDDPQVTVQFINSTLGCFFTPPEGGGVKYIYFDQM